MRAKFTGDTRGSYTLVFDGEPSMLYCPIGNDPTGWKIYDGGVLQGQIIQNYYATGRNLSTAIESAKGSEFEAKFRGKSSDECVDPRVLMFVIVSGRLFWLNIDAGLFKTSSLFAEKINAVFQFPTLEYAREWLAKNRFTGEKAYGEDGFPGWSLHRYFERKLVDLPPKAQKLHDELWLAARRNE